MIKIYRDNSLKLAYGSFMLILLMIAAICYLFGYDEYHNFLVGSVLVFFLFITQLDNRPILIINNLGIKRKGKKLLKWEDIQNLSFERRKIDNSTWTSFEIKVVNKKKSIRISLKRTTIVPRDFYIDLVEYVKDLNINLSIRGLKDW